MKSFLKLRPIKTFEYKFGKKSDYNFDKKSEIIFDKKSEKNSDKKFWSNFKTGAKHPCYILLATPKKTELVEIILTL